MLFAIDPGNKIVDICIKIPSERTALMKNLNRIDTLLSKALERFGDIQGLAEEMRVSIPTVRLWQKKGIPSCRISHLKRILEEEKTVSETSCADFTFIDLFAGIGGIRAGFEAHDGQCVFTCEWDKYAQKTYTKNFPGSSNHRFVSDINSVTTSLEQIKQEIPDHDVLLAGFPCQPFSIAGVSKKNSLGRAHGFKCESQGNLFFKIRDIIKAKQPVAFLLENVRNLKGHDKGNTYKVIMHTLEVELGYTLFPMIVDAKGFVPQHRERIFLVGFKKQVGFDWKEFRKPKPDAKKMGDILHRQDGKEKRHPDEDFLDANGRVNPKYILSQKLWDYLKAYKENHRKKGNGFGYGDVGKNDVARTLSARYYKDGSEILVRRQGGRPRRLTPRECARLMGYPDSFRIPVSDTQAYKQFGNSVVVPVIKEIARIMKRHIIELKNSSVDDSPDLSQQVVNG